MRLLHEKVGAATRDHPALRWYARVAAEEQQPFQRSDAMSANPALPAMRRGGVRNVMLT
ncbi:MAG TPA: hypothetical protein PK384_10165 [Candidatus Latescibacteria bacterium]|nr:hypothetical protein [Candidatus Latescibacterota bacterium]